ncbi:MAG: hypothetical protein K6A65_00385 [Succinivibrionaceae bacterium]|nr:hypothetical protein [Succinivibrionaceae bacterium]
MGMDISASGIGVAQSFLGSSAHNVANLGTEGFHPQRMQAAERPQGGAEVAQVQRSQAVGADAAAELTGQQSSSVLYRANAKALEVQDQVLGSLLDTRA